jgi:hypothetical protein
MIPAMIRVDLSKRVETAPDNAIQTGRRGSHKHNGIQILSYIILISNKLFRCLKGQCREIFDPRFFQQ